jgi:D-alanyl-D-alanine carboxypeptidase
MKRNTNVLILILFTLALVACGGGEPSPTPEPAQEPTAAPATESTEEPATVSWEQLTPVPTTADEAAAEGVNLYAVNGWQWESFTSPDTGRTDIADPWNYRLLIIQDIDLAEILTNECDLVILSDYLIDGKALTFSTDDKVEACSTDPLVDQYVQYVLASANYQLENGKLIIDLMADGGIMEFSPYDPMAAYKVTSWDEALQKQMKACGTPGAVLLVDTPSGRLLKANGVASTEDGTPVQVGDAFEIGSNTKSFTTILALQLQEEGVWSLDDPLSTYLPDQAAKFPNGDKVTLRQLGQNTSGFADYANPLIGAAIENDDLEHGYTPEELVDYAVENGDPPFEPFEPGEGWSYSTTNFVLLAMAIESVTGKKIADLYQERIFQPLGMEDSFLLEGVPEPGQVINGYYTSDDGEVINTTAWNGSQGWAGGGNVSTAEDMAKYAEGLAAGELFQDPSSLGQMLTFVSGGFTGFTGGYGLGVGAWIVGDTNAWGHEGQSAGFQSWWGVFPDEEATVILLTNSASCKVSDFRNYIAASPEILNNVEN